MFFLFMVCYNIRMLYQFLYYDGASISSRICSYLARELIAEVVPLAWEIVPNVTIMYWHHENFKTVNFLDRLRPLFCCCPCLRGEDDSSLAEIRK